MPVVVLDSGANVDCSAAELVQFARLGAVYAEDVLGRPNPAIAPYAKANVTFPAARGASPHANTLGTLVALYSSTLMDRPMGSYSSTTSATTLMRSIIGNHLTDHPPRSLSCPSRC